MPQVGSSKAIPVSWRPAAGLLRAGRQWCEVSRRSHHGEGRQRCGVRQQYLGTWGPYLGLYRELLQHQHVEPAVTHG